VTAYLTLLSNTCEQNDYARIREDPRKKKGNVISMRLRHALPFWFSLGFGFHSSGSTARDNGGSASSTGAMFYGSSDHPTGTGAMRARLQFKDLTFHISSLDNKQSGSGLNTTPQRLDPAGIGISNTMGTSSNGIVQTISTQHPPALQRHKTSTDCGNDMPGDSKTLSRSV